MSVNENGSFKCKSRSSLHTVIFSSGDTFILEETYLRIIGVREQNETLCNCL